MVVTNKVETISLGVVTMVVGSYFHKIQLYMTFYNSDRSAKPLLLRSEIPSGICAKLRTVAASNNRDHARNLSYYCLLALHI